MEKDPMADPITPPADQTATPPQGVIPAALNQEVGSGEKDWKAEAEKWQALSKKHEGNWKSVSTERDRLAQAGMSDADKALAEAEDRGRKAALDSVASERAQLKLEAAAARAGVDLAPVLKHLDVKQFVTADGVDDTAIGEFVSGFSQFAAPKGPKFAQGLGFGPQGSGTAGQLTREQVRGMSPREVAAARKEGRLDALLRGQI
jgi:hypothetical protein